MDLQLHCQDPPSLLPPQQRSPSRSLSVTSPRPDAGYRPRTLSLWRPEDPKPLSDLGPDSINLPDSVWLVGLGTSVRRLHGAGVCCSTPTPLTAYSSYRTTTPSPRPITAPDSSLRPATLSSPRLASWLQLSKESASAPVSLSVASPPDRSLKRRSPRSPSSGSTTLKEFPWWKSRARAMAVALTTPTSRWPRSMWLIEIRSVRARSARLA
jgi:hypothetical protein